MRGLGRNQHTTGDAPINTTPRYRQNHHPRDFIFIFLKIHYSGAAQPWWSYDEPPRSPGGFRRVCKLIHSRHHSLFNVRTTSHATPQRARSCVLPKRKITNGILHSGRCLADKRDSCVEAPADCARMVRKRNNNMGRTSRSHRGPVIPGVWGVAGGAGGFWVRSRPLLTVP